jgi:ParB family chromosome partitioning protein
MSESKPTRPGLGRGLGSLIPSGPSTPSTPAPAAGTAKTEAPPTSAETAPTALVPVDGAIYAEIPVDSVRPNPQQPRQVFDQELLNELVASITEVGVLQPIVVREASAGQYELIMGERRLRATQLAGLTTVPAIIRATKDEDLLRDALLENLHRAELNPLEEAAAYQQLLEDFGCTQEELSERIGRSRPQITNTIRLLKLSPAVQRRVASSVLSAGHARTLLSIEDPASQDRMAARVVAEGISVRQLEEIVRFGDGQDKPAARKASIRPTDSRGDEFARELSDWLDTRVKVDIGKSKGKVTIDFATVEDLRRIAELILRDSND